MVFGKRKAKEPVYKRQVINPEDVPEDVEEKLEEEILDVPAPLPVRKVKKQKVVEEQEEEEEVEEEDVEDEESEEEEQESEKQYEKKDVVFDWSVQEVPTATQPVIYNKKTKKALNLYEAVAEILNRSEED